LFSQEIFLSRPDPLVRHSLGKFPEKTKSCAIIAAIHELFGLNSSRINSRSSSPYFPHDNVYQRSTKVQYMAETYNLLYFCFKRCKITNILRWFLTATSSGGCLDF
jgi:hypothetical protein